MVSVARACHNFKTWLQKYYDKRCCKLQKRLWGSLLLQYINVHRLVFHKSKSSFIIQGKTWYSHIRKNWGKFSSVWAQDICWLKCQFLCHTLRFTTDMDLGKNSSKPQIGLLIKRNFKHKHRRKVMKSPQRGHFLRFASTLVFSNREN